MDITRHDLEKHKILIDVTIPPEELKTYVETDYKVIAESAQLEIPEDADPKPYVEKALGKDDADSMVDNLVMNAAAPLAVTRLRLDPFTSPQVGSEDHADPEKDFAFTCILYTKPEAHLSSYDPVELTIPKPEPVTEKDIDDELEYMARNFAEEDASGNAVIPAISDNWEVFVGAGDLGKQLKSISKETLEGLGIHSEQDYMRWLFELGHYENILMIDSGLGNKEVFENQVAEMGKTLNLKPIRCAEGWATLECAESLYNECKGYLS